MITTNEGPQKLTAQIKVNIFTNPDSTFPITIKPPKITFPDTGETVITEYYFSITNVSQQNLRPIVAGYPKALISVTLPKTIPAGQSAEGSIRLHEAAQRKGFEKSVTIQLDDAANTRFTIPVTRGAGDVPAAKGQSGH